MANPSAALPMPPNWVRYTVMVLAGAAFLVAGYLFFASSVAQGQPVGCGEGSGCAEVLSSRWSQVAGIPVTVPAALTYLLVIGTMWFLPRANEATRPMVWLAATVLASILLLAAAWFTGIQWLYLNALCPWCLVEHLLGVLIAGLILTPLLQPRLHQQRQPGRMPNPRRCLVVGGTIGGLLFCILIAWQILGPYTPPPAQRLASSGTVAQGEGSERRLILLDGQLEIGTSEVPLIGSPGAEHLIAIMYDYCCPHCRVTHGYLLDALVAYPDQIALLMLPMPLNPDCNPFWEQREARFEESCELARLALAVWSLDARQFVELDRWLYEPETPRQASAARDYAETLVDADALAEALKQPWIEEQIRRNATAYHHSDAHRIPVVMSPQMDTMVGRPGTREEFFEILQEELGLGGEDE